MGAEVVGLGSGLVVSTSDESCFNVWVRFLLASASALVSSFGFLAGGSQCSALELNRGAAEEEEGREGREEEGRGSTLGAGWCLGVSEEGAGL